MHISRKEIENALFEKIKAANEAYRKGEPAMSDLDYDAMVARLKMMNRDHEWFHRPEPVVVKESRKSKLPSATSKGILNLIFISSGDKIIKLLNC